MINTYQFSSSRTASLEPLENRASWRKFAVAETSYAGFQAFWAMAGNILSLMVKEMSSTEPLFHHFCFWTKVVLGLICRYKPRDTLMFCRKLANPIIYEKLFIVCWQSMPGLEN